MFRFRSLVPIVTTSLAMSHAAPDRGRGVLIGDVVAICGGASCRHRTLLYKLLADEAGLSVSMVRGRYRHSDGRLGSHAWNEQYLEDGTVLLVDIMSPPRGWKFPTIQEERPKKYLGPNAEALYDRGGIFTGGSEG